MPQNQYQRDATDCRKRAAACRAEAKRCWGILSDDYLWSARNWEHLASVHEEAGIVALAIEDPGDDDRTVDRIGHYWKSMVSNRRIEEKIRVTTMERLEVSRALLKRTAVHWHWAGVVNRQPALAED